MAQLVEQFTRNEQVAGSNPAISSKKISSIIGEIFLYKLKAWYVITPQVCMELQSIALRMSSRHRRAL